MGAFATDSSVGGRDLELLRNAVSGDKQALDQICNRFKTPILAVAIQTTTDLEQAYSCVETVLASLCSQLLVRRFPPEQWADRLIESVSRNFRAEGRELDNDTDSTQPSLSGLGSIPRLARRRVIKASLPKLPLPELVAILLQYLDQMSPSAMMGLVAETESEVDEKIVSAHELLVQELQSQVAASHSIEEGSL